MKLSYTSPELATPAPPALCFVNLHSFFLYLLSLCRVPGPELDPEVREQERPAPMLQSHSPAARGSRKDRRAHEPSGYVVTSGKAWEEGLSLIWEASCPNAECAVETPMSLVKVIHSGCSVEIWPWGGG